MPAIYYLADPFIREDALLALEAGADGILTTLEYMAEAAAMAHWECISSKDVPCMALATKSDEQALEHTLLHGGAARIASGFAILPVENLLAHPDTRVSGHIWAEAAHAEEAKLAMGILERGVSALVLLPSALPDIASIVQQTKAPTCTFALTPCTITSVRPAGLGQRVAVDTLHLFGQGEGLLVGNSSQFTFLLHAETIDTTFVAPRPFRVNAGGLHGYTFVPNGKTCYLSEIEAGTEVLAVNAKGEAHPVLVGRAKVEARPMLLIEAQGPKGTKGTVFVQNAESIFLVSPSGDALSVATLQEGAEVLCYLQAGARHFGRYVEESLREN